MRQSLNLLFGTSRRAIFSCFALGFSFLAIYDYMALAIPFVNAKRQIDLADVGAGSVLALVFFEVVCLLASHYLTDKRIYGTQYRNTIMSLVVLLTVGLIFLTPQRDPQGSIPLFYLGAISYVIGLGVLFTAPVATQQQVKKLQKTRENERRKGVLR